MVSEWVRIFLVSVVIFWGAAQLFVAGMVTWLSPSVRIALVAIGICSIIVATDRDTYLPFLGHAALPASVLASPSPTISPNSKNILVIIEGLPPDASVAWWASKPLVSTTTIQGPTGAYGDFSNAGVVRVGKDGRAHISMQCPKRYWVPGFLGARRVLPTHLHYRFTERRGMLSSVRTKQLECDSIS